MLNVLKNFKETSKVIKAPISGRTIDLSQVNDEVFSKKMMGEGIAIESTGNVVVAPVDGKITVIAKTKHAFGMTLKNGMEILVHIGLDTVNLKGNGFEVLTELNSDIKAGTAIIKFNRELIESKGVSLMTLIVILNHKDYEITKYNTGIDVIVGKSNIIEYR